MLEEDLDDTHLCIKCSATIVGLDNYVQHRKTNCVGGKAARGTIISGYEGFEYPGPSGYVKTEVGNAEGKASKTLSDPYDLPYELGADVFFSSLQLQSVQANSGSGTGKTTSVQHISNRKGTSSGRDETENDWQEETENNTDNLMKVVRDIGETKKFEQIFQPISFAHGSPEPEQSDDEEDDDDDFDDDDDIDYVPMPYCGGKWKPGSQPSSSRCGGKWKGKGNSAPSTTGGKWHSKVTAIESDKWKPSRKLLNIGSPSPTELSTPQMRSKTHSKKNLVAKIKETEHSKPSPKFLKTPQSKAIFQETEDSNLRSKLKPKLVKFTLPLTGSKWNPSEGNESPEILHVPTGGKWKSEDVPSTSGKWKPGNQPISSVHSTSAWNELESWEETSSAHPPLEYTKGKWVPGTKVEKLAYKEEDPPPAQDFWCNICCRKLKTKTIYEKHLKSGVHMKKSETEEQLERVGVNQLELSSQAIQPPPLLIKRWTSPEPSPGKRKRRKTFIKCDICKHRMQRYLMGKHLISHYHYVRRVIDPAKAYGMVLDNIHQIVLQSPFQCNPCRFYANTEENFLDHWNSVEHRDRTEGPGKFCCNFCCFECEDNNQMRRHLLGTDHREVILAINRSVPIIISKKIAIKCPKCRQEFRYNMELLQHSRCGGCKEEEPIGTASDVYQSKFRCVLCPNEVLKSKTALQRHEKFKHNKQRYYCSICDEEFESAKKAIKHRKTKEHRKKSADQMKSDKRINSGKNINENLKCEQCDQVSSSKVEAMLHQITHLESCKKTEENSLELSKKEPTDGNFRKCLYCKQTFKTKSELKSHLNAAHPDTKYICPLCGEAFTLYQELSSHTRYKICVASTSKGSTGFSELPSHKKDTKISWKCSDCTFSSAYESELIFHRIFHTHGVEALQKGKKLKCPLCEKSFNKNSLRPHLRQHTNEKIFRCEICKRSYSRRNNLKEHMVYIHSIGEGAKKRKTGSSVDESLICDTCGKIFATKYSLKLHISIHTERDKKLECPVENCQYIGRNRAALNMHTSTHIEKPEFKCQIQNCNYSGKSAHHLKRHMKNHLEQEKAYKCPECDFRGKIPAHIRRHVRIHTGECPYKCPHCDYSCGYIENLRKHILTTKKHPGKFIYQCTKCDPDDQYKTNYNNEYQLHLMAAHKT